MGFLKKCVRVLDNYRAMAIISCIISDMNGKISSSAGHYGASVPVNTWDGCQGIRPVDRVTGTAPLDSNSTIRGAHRKRRRYF